MKKAFLLFTAAVLFCLTGCSSHSDSEKNNTVPVDTVKILTANGTSVTVGSTLELQAQIKPDNASDKLVYWSSENSSVASVKEGVVTGIKAGTSKITVTSRNSGKSDSVTVTVTEKSSASEDTGETGGAGGSTESGGTGETGGSTESGGTGGTGGSSGTETDTPSQENVKDIVKFTMQTGVGGAWIHLTGTWTDSSYALSQNSIDFETNAPIIDANAFKEYLSGESSSGTNKYVWGIGFKDASFTVEANHSLVFYVALNGEEYKVTVVFKGKVNTTNEEFEIVSSTYEKTGNAVTKYANSNLGSSGSSGSGSGGTGSGSNNNEVIGGNGGGASGEGFKDDTTSGNTDPNFTIAVTEAQAVAEYDSLEAPKDSNYVSFIFENVTNGKFKNNEIFIVVLYQRGDGIYYWGRPDGTYKAVAANEYCTDYSYTIADDDGTDGRRVFNIPKNTNGARIFYSYGSKMSIHGPDNGVGVVFPSIANPNDPDYNKYYDWLEYTIREDGVTWVNTTQVDQFGFPALITAYASDGSVRSNGDNLFTQTGVAISRSEVYQKYYDYMESKGISSDFDCLAEKYRIVCPGKSSKFNKNYLDDYINEVWNYWTTHSTTVNHAQGKFTLTCDGTNLNFKCTESKNAAMCTVGETYSVHGKPTTEQAFEGSGCLATDTKGTGMEPALQAWVCAALNRHVATRSDNPAWGYTTAPAPASYNAAYYLEGKANYYSGFWHSISTNNGLAYGFCYDDVHEQSSTTVVNDCQKIWVRLGF
ncbi:MAG: beta-1,3-glucanase family protein [Spirochaetia bacterium]|nr:beta-1,3-glucanase family protein [Spirochaetia bacterium]